MQFNRIFIPILFFIMSSLSLLAAENDYAGQYALAGKHRSYPITVWGREVIKFLPFVGTEADIKICLHHLAGNVMHIIGMHANEGYFQYVRTNEMSHRVRIDYCDRPTLAGYSEPSDVVDGKNSKDDLKKMIGLLQRWESLENTSEAMQQFCSDVRLAEQESQAYRNQRKLSERTIRIRNPEKCGIDDEIPDYVTLRINYPKATKKF